MIQKKTITVKQCIGKSKKIAYSLAYKKELSKQGSLYIVNEKGTDTLKTTSIEEAVNFYNSII